MSDIYSNTPPPGQDNGNPHVWRGKAAQRPDGGITSLLARFSNCIWGMLILALTIILVTLLAMISTRIGSRVHKGPTMEQGNETGR